jgi:uncharacterized membrane protein YjjP (DUF1212 family)
MPLYHYAPSLLSLSFICGLFLRLIFGKFFGCPAAHACSNCLLGTRNVWRASLNAFSALPLYAE